MFENLSSRNALCLGIISILLFAGIFSSLDYSQPAPFSKNNRILSIVLAYSLDHHESLDLILSHNVALCESGWLPTVTMLTVVKHWEQNVTNFIGDRYFCVRTKSPLDIQFSIHDPSIGKHLAVEHRQYIADHLDSYDVFIYQEDDIIITPSNLQAYLMESHHIHEMSSNVTIANNNTLTFEQTFMPGFHRYAKKLHLSDSTYVKEHRSQDQFDSMSILRQDGLPEEAGASYKHICIKDTPYLMLLRGNSHQGMWILTRWQLQMLDQKCNFLQERGGGVPSIMVREFMSSFSIFKHHLENTKCPCGLEKVFPGRYMLNFIVQHYYDTETSRKAGDFVYTWEHFITSGSIKNGEHPPNDKLVFRLSQAPCWREIFAKVRAERNLPLINESEIIEPPFAEGDLIRHISSKRVSIIKDSTRRYMHNGAVFTNHGFQIDDVKVISDDGKFDWFPQGPDFY